ncbi:MAG TPA: hypothetical protein ENI60_00115 [Candidatus Fraserbacteria bacterium]|nr:hypothetical protein [Candidatus Fraserbacteria bacterium]
MSKSRIAQKACYGALALALLLGLTGTSALGANAPLAQPAPLKVLIIDETRTLTASFQVNALILALRGQPALSVAAQFAKVGSGMEFPPLQGVAGQRFDLIIIVPRKLTELRQIWFITRPWNELSPTLRTAVGAIAQVAEKIFGPTGVHPRDVRQDLVPGWFATIFERQGLL